MSTVSHLPDCAPVEPNEVCDANCPALALIAILYPRSVGGYGRLVFCAHHFADIAPEVKANIIAMHELGVDA